MGMCELCGKGAPLIRANIEGTELEVCQECGSFGKITSMRRHAPAPRAHISAPELEINETIDQNFAAIIHGEREKRKLTQEDFAKLLNEKESMIHKIETGILEPSIPLARKLEKALRIKLVQSVKEAIVENKYAGQAKMTIGDIIKIK